MTCVTLDICAFKILSTIRNLQPMFLNSKHEDFSNLSHRLWGLHLSSSSKIHFIKWKSYCWLVLPNQHCHSLPKHENLSNKTLSVFTKSKEQIILSRWIEIIPVSGFLFPHSLGFLKCGIRRDKEKVLKLRKRNHL